MKRYQEVSRESRRQFWELEWKGYGRELGRDRDRRLSRGGGNDR